MSSSLIIPRRAAALMVSGWVFWMCLAMDFHPISLLAAAGFALIATLVSASVSGEKNSLQVSLLVWRLDRLALYFASVLAQSYLAVFELICRMLTGRYSPGVVRIRTHLRSRVGRVVLANTISLIPGTMTLWIEGDHLFVHWFDRKTTHALRAGRMIKEASEKRLERIFG
ncbi:MAG: Na+/H+ antiporter subunit E [Kiritimatiellia bacterium]|nr:Na+/H+ antiporter subunit E [Kiritimatiellia bacterium]